MFSFINTNKFSIILISFLAGKILKKPRPKGDGVSMRKNYLFCSLGVVIG